MISKINAWAGSIIIAVMISIIIEMLLPNGSNKKYVKVISGLYILYIIVSPFFKVDIDSSIENIESVINKDYAVATFSENDLKESYILSLENALKTKIEDLGYSVENVEFSVTSDYSEVVKIKVKMKNENYDKSKIEKIILEEYDIEKKNLSID
jgi:stage III sporulation protein AF